MRRYDLSLYTFLSFSDWYLFNVGFDPYLISLAYTCYFHVLSIFGDLRLTLDKSLRCNNIYAFFLITGFHYVFLFEIFLFFTKPDLLFLFMIFLNSI